MNTDEERLDWLSRHPRMSEIMIDGKTTTCYFYGVAGHAMVSLRDIIDAAMEADHD